MWVALLVATHFPGCDARSWIDVVDPSIYAASSLDIYRMELFLERDPLTFPTSAPSVEPSVPTGEEDTESPSAAPSSIYDRNGGCSIGKYLYNLKMYDDWGDGWDGAVIKITQMAMEEESEDIPTEYQEVTSHDNVTVSISKLIDLDENTTETSFNPARNIFTGGLATGSEGTSSLCLQPFKCYSVDMAGGYWAGEIKWDIRAVRIGYTEEELENFVGMPVAKGFAPSKCQFSIADEVTGELECPFTCEGDSASPFMSPSSVPSLVPSMPPSSVPSDLLDRVVPTPVPSSASSTFPSDFPSLVPSTLPSSTPSIDTIVLT